MSVHAFPITTRREQLHVVRPAHAAAPVYVHPTVSHDVRRSDCLEQTTGHQIIINDRGEPVLQRRSTSVTIESVTY